MTEIHSKPIEMCYWVVPGNFLAGEYPRTPYENTSRQKIRALLDAGINVFIDLTEPGELLPYEPFLTDAEKISFPIRDVSIPKSTESVSLLLDLIDQHLNDGNKIYIHCWGGRGRTGTIVGCWLARHGKGGEQALNDLKELWQNCPKSSYSDSPETEEQRQFVLNWKSGQ